MLVVCGFEPLYTHIGETAADDRRSQVWKGVYVMKQSFRFGYAAGQEVVNRLSHMTKQEASQKIPSVILSVLMFILGFLLAEHMATFGWYMVFDMLKGWAIICSLWFFTSLIILLLRLKGTAVKRNLIIRYAGKTWACTALPA